MFALNPSSANTQPSNMIMKIRFLAALAPIVAVNAWGFENPRAHDSKDDGEWHPDLRIIGGSEAIEDRFSYAVSLQDGTGLVCGGSLIAKDVVLTAAHCAPKAGAFFPLVVLGRHDLSNSDDGKVFPVRQQVTHPEHGNVMLDNDFMLVFLEGASTDDNVITVKLNSDPLVPSVGQDVTVMGWGDTDNNIVNFEPSYVLMNVDMSVISNQECDASELIIGLITDNMLCARANGIHCNGDSGGPMIIKGDDSATDVQVGVVSWGNYCQSHAVYDRVSQAYDWIQSEVCRESNYATEAGFHCSSISTNPPISSPTNPPVVSSISTNPPISSPADPTVVSPSNDGIFIDTVVWNDIYGDGCDWYEANGYPGCPRYGSGDYGGIGVADDNCWWCVMG